jgi:dGTPase
VLTPDKLKDITRVSAASARTQYPGTLEGCVVRYADRVAYLATDLQDAKELGIIKKSQVPQVVRRVLGEDTGEIVGHVIEDIVRESSQNKFITTSDGIFKVLKELYEFSNDYIYNCTFIIRQKPWVKNILKQLFEGLKGIVDATDRGKDKKAKVLYSGETNTLFFNFLDTMKYPDEVPPGQIILDYMAGMTDSFAKRSFDELIPIRTPIRKPR